MHFKYEYFHSLLLMAIDTKQNGHIYSFQRFHSLCEIDKLYLYYKMGLKM